MVLEPKNPSFVPFKCRCGRALRAKWDQVGTEIRCWDCHELVFVRSPNPRARLASRMSDRFQATIRGDCLARLATAALIVTAALSVPQAGLGVAALVLFFLAAAYGETIRRGDAAPEDAEMTWRTFPRPRTIPEGIGCALMVAGAAVPLWVAHAADHRSPRLDPVTLVVLGLTWLAMPAVMVLVFAREPGEWTGGRRVLAILGRHPGLLAVSLLVVPIGLIAIEAGLGLAFYLRGTLPFFAMEYMPLPGKPAIYTGVPHYDSVDFRLLPQGPFYRGYFRGLRDGYSFLGAIPPSLSLPTRVGLSPEIIGLVPFSCAVARFFLAAIIVGGALVAYSVQARWLGLLTLLEKASRQEPAKADAR